MSDKKTFEEMITERIINGVQLCPGALDLPEDQLCGVEEENDTDCNKCWDNARKKWEEENSKL